MSRSSLESPLLQHLLGIGKPRPGQVAAHFVGKLTFWPCSVLLTIVQPIVIVLCLMGLVQGWKFALMPLLMAVGIFTTAFFWGIVVTIVLSLGEIAAASRTRKELQKLAEARASV